MRTYYRRVVREFDRSSVVDGIGREGTGIDREALAVGSANLERHFTLDIAALHLNLHGDGVGYIDRGNTQVDSRSSLRSLDIGRVLSRRRERLVTTVAENQIDQFGIVDEGVAVALLRCIHGLVAVNLLLAHGVHLVPTEQHVELPLYDMRIGRHEDTAPVVDTVLIARGKIEIGTGKVAFILVVGFEHRTGISGRYTLAPLGETVFRTRSTRANLAKGIVAAIAVYLAVGGIDMPGIGIHGRRIVEPTLGNRVLPIVAIALTRIITTLIRSKSKIGYIGIHIPHLSVGSAVGRFVNLPQAIISNIGGII